MEEIPVDFYEAQLEFQLASAEHPTAEGIVHQDFILTHPNGQYPVCGHKTYGNDAALAGKDYCLAPAGAGTDHLGKGFCARHDGKGLSLRHGRYTKYLKGILATRLEHFNQDPQILSLDEEISLMRAVLSELLSMKESCETSLNQLNEKKPGEWATDKDKDKWTREVEHMQREYKNMLMAIQDAVERVSKIVELKNKVEVGDRYTIHIEMLQVVVVQITNVLKKYIKDPEIIFNIGKDLSQLRIPTQKSE